MRYDILSFHQLGQSYILDGKEMLNNPYKAAIGDDNWYAYQDSLAGICVKTYQSDLFNNWLNNELVDGDNGISEITAISTSSGSITIDQLQFSEKLYNLLNRIAVVGTHTKTTWTQHIQTAQRDLKKAQFGLAVCRMK